MENNKTKEIKTNIYLNDSAYVLIKNYILKRGALGDYNWVFNGYSYEKTKKDSIADAVYCIKNREACYINNSHVTKFQVWELINDAYILNGVFTVKSRGLASVKKCLSSYLDKSNTIEDDDF